MLPRILMVAGLAAAYPTQCTPSRGLGSPPDMAGGGDMAATPLAGVVSTRPAVKPSLPRIPGGPELPPPPANMTLLKIGLGHGIQNYTCSSQDGSPSPMGALAVLYDVTPLYPGTPDTGLDETTFSALSTAMLWDQAVPLNLADKDVGTPGTRARRYGADVADPFPPPADATLPGEQQQQQDALPFLGRHFFDAAGTPTFDLPPVGLRARVAKKDAVDAPAGADRGVLGTGSVAWLLLAQVSGGPDDVSLLVYRVVTAGGNAQPCSVGGPGPESVPYAAFYWFYR